MAICVVVVVDGWWYVWMCGKMDGDMCCCRVGCGAVIMVLRRATKQDTDLQCWLALWVGVVMGGVVEAALWCDVVVVGCLVV